MRLERGIASVLLGFWLTRGLGRLACCRIAGVFIRGWSAFGGLEFCACSYVDGCGWGNGCVVKAYFMLDPGVCDVKMLCMRYLKILVIQA